MAIKQTLSNRYINRKDLDQILRRLFGGDWKVKVGKAFFWGRGCDGQDRTREITQPQPT